jgi:hypothetical protein
VTALHLKREVPHAPVQPGARVLVLVDCHDDSADIRFHGACGEVVGLLFDDPSSQFPARPLIEVTVPGLGTEWFFAGELQLLQ